MRTKKRKTKTNRGTGTATGAVWVPRKDRIGECSRRSERKGKERYFNRSV
jgi:hypothetical protein